MSLVQLWQGNCLELMKDIPDGSVDITFATDKQKQALHPTQKPVTLLEWLVRTYTNEDETVLDNCMGSGSTGVACINTNRNFIGIELDKQYFKIAENRIEETKGCVYA